MIKKFNDLLLENKDSKNNLKKAVLYLKNRFNTKNIYLTYLLARVYQIEKIFFISKIEFSENPEDIIYAYVYENSKFYDSNGEYSLEEIMKIHKLSKNIIKDFTFIASFSLLEKVIENKKSPFTREKTKELISVLKSISESK
jgi:hypothetical protein